MKLKLLLLPLFSIICLASCNSNNKKQDKEIEVVQIDSTLNILLSWQLPIPDDSAKFYEPREGADCYFRRDSTFIIFLWEYGMGSGRRFGPRILGHYVYDPPTREISLIFDGKSDEVGFYSFKPTPLSFYTMIRLAYGWHSEKINEMIDKDLPDYDRSFLKIKEKTAEGKVLVDLYAYDGEEKISFGEIEFSERELIPEDSVINHTSVF